MDTGSSNQPKVEKSEEVRECEKSDPNNAPEGALRLYDCAKNNLIEELSALCTRHAFNSDVLDFRHQSSGQTPLFVASFYDHEECVQLLLDAGCNRDLPDINGDTPLFVCAYMGKTRSLKRLIAAGADVHKVGKNGKTPLQAASKRKHADCERFLATAASKEEQTCNIMCINPGGSEVCVIA